MSSIPTRHHDDPKSNILTTFGSIGDFWIKYDKLADKFDKDMLGRLNTNLDVLLIFAGLFSAVNTSFIVVTLTALSANPIDQTNHLLQLLVTNINNNTLTATDPTQTFSPATSAVRQNCTFFASLSCSLLAAAGAMVAKQWLQEYERTGQTGTIEEQARRRAAKFAGAERWGLRSVVEALPTLLLISLALFFVALVDSLWDVDKTVALVVLAFAAAGVVFYAFTVIAAAADEACPFQTAISAAIRRLYTPLRGFVYSNRLLGSRAAPYAMRDLALASLRLGTSTLVEIVKAAHRDHQYFPLEYIGVCFMAALCVSWSAIAFIILVFLSLLLKLWPRRAPDTNQVDAHSVIWMAETAPNLDNFLVIAKNIPLITHVDVIRLVAHSLAFKLLLSQFAETLLIAQYQPIQSNVTDAVTLARAVAHVLLADPEHTAVPIARVCIEAVRSWTQYGVPERIWIGEFKLLFKAIVMSCREWAEGQSSQMEILIFRLEDLLQVLDRSPHQDLLNSSDLTIYFRHCILSGLPSRYSRTEADAGASALADEICSALLLKDVTVDDACLKWALRTLVRQIRIRIEPFDLASVRDRKKLTWEIDNDLVEDISELLEILIQYYSFLHDPSHPRQEERHSLSRILRSLAQLLIHLHVLHPTFDTLPREHERHRRLDRDHSEYGDPFERMHSAINSNIERLSSIKNDYVPPAERLSVVACQDQLVEVLAGLLLTDSSVWPTPDAGHLADTARFACTAYSANITLLQGLLYRSFLLLASHQLPTGGYQNQNRHKIPDPTIAPVLTSALCMCVQLYPQDGDLRSWSIFEDFLRYIAIGPGEADERESSIAAQRVPIPTYPSSHLTMESGVTAMVRPSGMIRGTSEGITVSSLNQSYDGADTAELESSIVIPTSHPQSHDIIHNIDATEQNFDRTGGVGSGASAVIQPLSNQLDREPRESLAGFVNITPPPTVQQLGYIPPLGHGLYPPPVPLDSSGYHMTVPGVVTIQHSIDRLYPQPEPIPVVGPSSYHDTSEGKINTAGDNPDRSTTMEPGVLTVIRPSSHCLDREPNDPVAVSVGQNIGFAGATSQQVQVTVPTPGERQPLALESSDYSQAVEGSSDDFHTSPPVQFIVQQPWASSNHYPGTVEERRNNAHVPTPQ
ncbi:hypothetical protein FRB97_003123, partial [Tulasnella sp. 331]